MVGSISKRSEQHDMLWKRCKWTLAWLEVLANEVSNATCYGNQCLWKRCKWTLAWLKVLANKVSNATCYGDLSLITI